MTSSSSFGPGQHIEIPPDEKCWKEMVISLDGGGIRGVSTLIILGALMDEIKIYHKEWGYEGSDTGLMISKDENGKSEAVPGLCFDYAIGTSTGGLIAIMIGRLRMGVDACIGAYKSFGKIFAMKRLFRWDQYDHRKLEAAIVEVARNNCTTPANGPNGHHLLMEPEGSGDWCRTAVLAVSQGGSNGLTVRNSRDALAMFRSYPSSEGSPTEGLTGFPLITPGQFENVCIYQAGRATSAAPHYFREAVINGVRFIDGGVVQNNPTLKAYGEAKNMNAQRDEAHRRFGHVNPVGLVVSIGTGRSASYSLFRGRNFMHHLRNLCKRAVQAITDVEPVHEYAESFLRDNGIPYFRFTVDEGLEHVKMDEWHESTLSNIEHATRAYLAQLSVKEALRDCAKTIVRQHRARILSSQARMVFQPVIGELPGNELHSVIMGAAPAAVDQRNAAMDAPRSASLSVSTELPQPTREAIAERPRPVSRFGEAVPKLSIQRYFTWPSNVYE